MNYIFTFTNSLTGAALDYAVARAANLRVYDGWQGRWDDQKLSTDWYFEAEKKAIIQEEFHESGSRNGTWRETARWQPSTDWVQGGPIIEQEKIAIMHGSMIEPEYVEWHAISYGAADMSHTWRGPTPLIAAMRCYVASKLGDTVEIPKELL